MTWFDKLSRPDAPSPPPTPADPVGDAPAPPSRCLVAAWRIGPDGGWSVGTCPAGGLSADARTVLRGLVSRIVPEGGEVRAALVPVDLRKAVTVPLGLPFDGRELCALASPVIAPSLRLSPHAYGDPEGTVTAAGGAVRWPVDLQLGGSLPGEPYAPYGFGGRACFEPLGWSP